MNDRKALMAIAEVLNANLDDPRVQYGEAVRSWAHTDMPLQTAKYPRIEVQKSDPGTQEIIDIGENFLEWNMLLVDIWFYVESEFKYTLTQDNSILKNEELCREYQDKIWDVIKSKQSYFKSQYGLTGFKCVSRPEPTFNNGMNKFVIRTTIRLWYFDR